METWEDLVLGALWHDIGRFKARACLEEDIGRDSQEVGAVWLAQHYGEALITQTVSALPGSKTAEGPRNLNLIISEAKRGAAAGKTLDPDTHSALGLTDGRFLTNIFSRIRDPRRPNIPETLPHESLLPLAPLGNWLEPMPSIQGAKLSSEEYRRHWQQFEKDFNLLKVANLHRSLDLVLHLLEKHLSTVPLVGAGGEEPEAAGFADISLFDHLKITAALAHCLLNFLREKYPGDWQQRALTEEITGPETWREEAPAPFLLVGGDISGVQRFIYTIASTGALKSVKGRSFFLELFTEHVVDYLLMSLNLSRCNVLFTGGGHFYLAAPNTDSVVENLQAVQGDINEYLWQDFNGRLQMFIAGEPFNKAALAQAGEVFSRLSARLEEAKRQPWLNRLDGLLGNPQAPHPRCLTEHCEVCGREDQKLVSEKVGDTSQQFCISCREQFLLGETLQTALRESGGSPVIFALTARPPDGERALEIRTSGFVRYYLTAKSSEHPPPNLTGIYRLNSWNLTDFLTGESRPFLSSTYHEKDFQDLEGLVHRGFGMEQVGVLRMDMDFLGKIFSTPFPVGEDLLTRKASLSRQLSLFFKYHLDRILQANGPGYSNFRTNLSQTPPSPRKLSVVYAGGDDLFILGHWLDVLEAAADIRGAFLRFTANPALTLSGGYIAAPVHLALYRLASQSGEAEFRAKKAGGDEKNRLGLGGARVFTWEDLQTEVFRVLGFLRGLLENDPAGRKLTPVPQGVSRGFFFRLLQLCRDRRRDEPLKLPALAWIFGRHKPKEEKLSESWLNLQNYVFNRHFAPPVLETALLWTVMMMRKGGEE